MWLLAKIVLSILIVGLVVQQAQLYYSVVIVGNYFANASIGTSIMTGILWPVVVAGLAFIAIRFIIRFDPKSLENL